MAEHLGQRQVGLRDGDVAEQRLGQLVAGARAARRSARRSAPPGGAWNSKPLVDQRDVVGDRLAVAGEHDLGRQLPRLAQRLDVGHERLRAARRVAGRRPSSSGRAISGFEEMCLIRWSAAIRILRSRVPEDRVGWAVPGPVQDLAACGRAAPGARRRAAAASPSPSRPRPGTPTRPCAARCTMSSGMPLRSITPLANSSSRAASSREVLGEAGPACRSPPPRRPEWPDDDVDQAEVVDVLVREHDQLDVVDRAAVLGELVLELVERLARVRARSRPASAGRPRSGRC